MAKEKKKQKRKSAERTCRGCGDPEKKNAIGHSNISSLGYCATCIGNAMTALRREDR